MSDRQWTKEIAAEAEQVLREHFQGRVHVKHGRASYGSGNAEIKFQFAKLDESGEATTKERQAFERFAGNYGLDADDLGQTFSTHAGDEYEITGLNTRAKKYPIQAKRVRDGKQFKFPASQVKAALARSA